MKNRFTFHTLNTNYYLKYYNPLHNIKFTKEKKKVEKKNYQGFDFLKLKYHTRKKKKINHSTIQNIYTNYYLKYL